MVQRDKAHRTAIEFVSVKWHDAWKSSTQDATPDNAPDLHKPALQETRGWLLVSDAEGVQLYNEKCLDPDSNEYRGATFIPRGMIQSVEPFPPKRKRKNATRITADLTPDRPEPSA